MVCKAIPVANSLLSTSTREGEKKEKEKERNERAARELRAKGKSQQPSVGQD